MPSRPHAARTPSAPGLKRTGAVGRCRRAVTGSRSQAGGAGARLVIAHCHCVPPLALAALALREAIRQDIEHGRGSRVHEASELGAPWNEVAVALAVTSDEARTLLRQWASGQHHLYCGTVERAIDNPLGPSPERHAAVLGLV